MVGFRTLRARWRLSRANADFLRCKDEWAEAEARQDCRRMSVAAANLKAARNAQMRAEVALGALSGRRRAA
ncbi:hypothetical protein [Brevundimonas diminuta]|uniref:hypothetical protein n=1 Tax=Brevundimonas diminuta TaxID=293 RepID=UPI00320B27B5